MLESGRLTPDSLATILLRKADWHDAEGVKLMLQHGADPNRMTRWGYTALHQALRRDNRLEIIETMLDHGADAALKNQQTGQSGFAMAARKGRGDVLRVFQERDIATELDGVERLIAACAMNDAEAVRNIVKEDSKLRDQLLAQGGNLLAEFSGNGNTDGVRHLLDLGVNVAALYTDGDPYHDVTKDSTALHVAAWRARHATVRLLIERGAPVNQLDAKGRSPLVLAVKACVDSFWTDRRTPESVEALLQAGASVKDVEYPCGYKEVDELLNRISEDRPREVKTSELSPITGDGSERKLLVRKGGLEPPRLTAPDPKSGASANSATFASLQSTVYTTWFRCTVCSVVTFVGTPSRLLGYAFVIVLPYPRGTSAVLAPTPELKSSLNN